MRYRALIATILAVCLGFLTACSDGADMAKSTKPLTYEDIRNTGLANNCPQLKETSRGSIPLEPGAEYVITSMCLQPTSYFVKEEPKNSRQEAEFVAGRVLTRLTSSLDQISGPIKIGKDGVLTFTETDGIDFQPITVLLPGGEEVPFLFTIKGLVASSDAGMTSINTSTDFQGSFDVPSYRSGAFLDPKGRGVSTGYDNAVALPSAADNYVKANVKLADTLKKAGTMSLQISKINGDSGEIGGIFESVQPSDSDLGAKEAVDVKVQGIFYGRVEKAS